MPKINDEYSVHRAHIMDMFKKREGSLADENHAHMAVKWRLPITKYIAENYEALSSISSQFQNNTPLNKTIETDAQHAIVKMLVDKKLLERSGEVIMPFDNASALYLAGGWLEELGWAAALEAGADAAIYGQRIHWGDRTIGGQNEIDVIAAFGDNLTFISCKALRPHINASSDKSRYRNLKLYLHEADDLADHFGIEGDRIIYLTTVDMIDEGKGGHHRHPSLAGKAKALDVQLVGLEQIGWDDLVGAINS